MKIATISMRRDNQKNQPNFEERINTISRLLKSEARFDLIATASSYFSDAYQLQKFTEGLKKINNTQTSILLSVGEIKDDGKDGKKSKNFNECIYLVRPGKDAVLIAKQQFSHSKNYNFCRDNFFEDLIENRFPDAGLHQLLDYDRSLTVGALSCGEINAFVSSPCDQKVLARDECVADRFNQTDLIYNPTHDRMGQCNHLNPKREYLSRAIGERARCYVSVSNWELNKRNRNGDRKYAQTPNALTLHTVYVGGERKDLIRINDSCNENFECREVELEF